MPVTTTLNFAGRTEEALDFYRAALDAEVLFLMRFRDSPDQSHTRPGMEDKIFHATYRIHTTEFMASDVGCMDEDATTQFAGFAFALRFESVDRAKDVFDALGDGGHVLLPLAKSQFTSFYGIVIDRFGISWKINVVENEDE
ncbi:VOC family protein [Planctomycetes bacterium K23_9]|uniref:PhnB-like domain-containing protein n=1 Tax=Stieleria marina TaxID=1930275 RepID=A0A517NMC9_9BACT|nr:hypothetical protein K239x_01740 [Planctomycetes bacterium K23_9]